MNSQHFRIRVFGPFACFTRPERGEGSISYEVMTPSSARAILESILWKPAIKWQIHSIGIYKPIKFISFKRNEVKSIMSRPTAAEVKGEKIPNDYFASDDRVQRNSLVLKDVDYVIEASFSLTNKAGSDDNINKFSEMFLRRLEKGQCHHMPYFGCREFTASFEEEINNRKTFDISKKLGMILYDIDFENIKSDENGFEYFPTIFFEAKLINGIMNVEEPRK